MVAAVVALAVLGAAVAGGTVVPTATQTAGVEPGEQFVGAVGAQHAEVSNTVETAALERRLANASTPTERASVLAAETDRVEARLGTLESRHDGLEEDDAGRIATVVAAATGLDARLDRLRTEAASLPTDVRERHGLTDERFAVLRDRAADLHDDADDDLARSVAGDEVGEGLETEEDDEADDDGDDADDDGDDDGSDGDGDETTEGDTETEDDDADDETAENDSTDDGDDGDTSDGDGSSDGDSGDDDTDDGDSSAGDSDESGAGTTTDDGDGVSDSDGGDSDDDGSDDDG